jgi:hypothetical protein
MTGKRQQPVPIACHEIVGLARFSQREQEIVRGIRGNVPRVGSEPIFSASSFNSLTRRPASHDLMRSTIRGLRRVARTV